MKTKVFFLQEDENIKLYEYINENVVFLNGELASGKTTLVSNILSKLCKERDIYFKTTSPTFSILNTYNLGDMKVYHYDFYQKEYSQILSNGLFETFFEEGLHFIEWGDENLKKLLQNYDIKYITINISKIEGKNDKRKYEIIYEWISS